MHNTWKRELFSIPYICSLKIVSIAKNCTGIETASKVEVLFANFLPHIEKVNEICKTAQYNKKACEAIYRDEFNDIEEIDKGGFGIIKSALTNDGIESCT
ncbi:kinase-like domain-containing protein [Rhizophagus irregularis DAOM 181602=DAOM 197198]|uniref:Uncharacterized protein n=1 Tax=Rhizophagus irregularis (strain DAOM 181602 / DAOM 197198 / MUCL 43194) TaxID=747089 RepID=A0A2P4PM35_RHIID|nr:hypothetical protein GLOIN_2v1780590 [Rhizophagus irregularis DAOM 181602=DAOM 197198]POG66435.1 hypothetical protein GLOIN_2v1780590 [Rhizophagus irregularis DAOM 181602=DAOM 197198]GBC28714.2 kinase-like domain-containing protein [Rhizophagus irregularis DAOM 181602=DAOM 197198]|eukprot:XP_025173301.1 hypothetical protein GLOIN_2v1780590 [Rhizophagus irregularis DAOM 181602=DAOM 197198]